MNENSKSKIVNVLDAVGGFLPYLITFEFPLCFSMLVTFIVKMAGKESDFMTALGFFCCFGLPIMWASAVKTILERMEQTKSKWKKLFLAVTAFFAIFAVIFGVVLANKFDMILAKL